jgi:VRR-NUC domain
VNAKQLLARDPKLLRETDLSGLVVDVAKLGHWRRYHTFDSRRSTHGFPDWVLVRDGRLVFAELKSQDGPVRPDQREWLDALSDVPGVEVFLWRPSDYDEIVTVLTGRAPA